MKSPVSKSPFWTIGCTVSVTGSNCTVPENRLVNGMVPMARLVAAPVRLTVALVMAWPGFKIPRLVETLSQDTGLVATAKPSARVPALVRVKNCDDGLNGPPCGPEKVRPGPGSTSRLSLVKFSGIGADLLPHTVTCNE